VREGEAGDVVALLRRLHLPQYEELYAKTRSRLGRILDKQRRAPKASKNPRKEAMEILDTAYNVLKSKLEAYRQLYELVSGCEEAKLYVLTVFGEEALRELAQAGFMANRLANLWRTLRKQVFYYGDTKEVKREALRAAARLLSYVKRRRRLLQKALEVKRELSKVLVKSEGLPVVVIAGPPNAGKSTLAKAVAKIRTEVGDYPFTTKEPAIGTSSSILPHLEVHVVDTPGMLAREKKNVIERRAYAMLKLPNSIVVFLLDPDPSSMLSYDEQILLLKEVMAASPFVIVAVNKVDAWRKEAEALREKARALGAEPLLISALTGEGLQSLLDALKSAATELMKLRLSRGSVEGEGSQAK